MLIIKNICSGLLPVFGALCLLVCPVSASPQQPDLFVLHGDTSAIYQLPLQIWLDQDEDNYYWDRLRSGQLWIATDNWRGYQAVWTIEEGRLWLQELALVSPDPLGLSNAEAVERILGTSLSDKLLLAEWYSGTIVVPNGELLRSDGVFGRTYTAEVILTFDHGVHVSTDTVSNYIPFRGAMPRRTYDDLNPMILEQIRTQDWTRLYSLGCDGFYDVTIGTNGRIVKVDHGFGELSNICSEAIARSVRDLQFDIVKWHGRAIEETIHLTLFFDEETGILHDLSANVFSP